MIIKCSQPGFQDGNKAYFALVERYCGANFRELLVEKARTKIRNASLEPTGDLGSHLAMLQHAFATLSSYGEGYTERHKVTTLLHSLKGAAWQQGRTELLLRATTFDEAIVLLQRTEPAVLGLIEQNTAWGERKSRSRKAKGKKNNDDKDGNQNEATGGGGRTTLKCWYCQETGHLKKDCPKRAADKKEKQVQARSTNGDQGNSTNTEDSEENDGPKFFNQSGNANMALVRKTRASTDGSVTHKVMTDSCCDTTFLGSGWYVVREASL